MPVLVRARQSRRFQAKDRANPAHRHLADQGFEVLPVGHRCAGLAEVSVEDPNLLRAPAQRLRLVHQVVLAVRALLIEAHLSQCRLTDVDTCLPRQVPIGYLEHHGHRAPPDVTAERWQPDRTRPCRRGWRPPWRSRGRRGPGPMWSTPDPRVAAKALR